MGQAASPDLVVAVLGRPQIIGPDGGHTVRGRRSIDLLSLLVAHQGRTVRRDTIEDELWDGEAVDPTAVRVNVSRLRRRFAATAGIDPIVSTTGGYSLVLTDDQVDAGRLRRSLEDARRAWGAGDVERALADARAGVDLWRGPAFDQAQDLPSIGPTRSLLGDVRRDLVDLLTGCLLRVGRPTEALDQAIEATTDDPYREASWALRIAALYVKGRIADALSDHDRVRAILRDDLDIGPSSLLRDLRDALARQATPDEVIDLVSPIAVSREDATPTGAGAVPRAEVEEPNLVGRATEVAIAEGLVVGRPRIWVVDGPPGVGKTRLGSAIRALAEGSGLVVAIGTCPRGVGVGQVALRQILGDLLRAIPPSVMADPSVGEALGTTFPELVTSQGTPSTANGPELRDAAQAETLVHGALERVVSATPPAVVVVDDVQWIDPRLASALAHLCTVNADVRWVFLTRTADRVPAATDLIADLARNGARFDTLSPLPDRDAAELVRRAAPDLTDATVDVAVDRAGGSPFALMELARHAAGGGDLGAVPAKVDAVIDAELAGLDHDAVALAEIVAVAGDSRPIAAATAAAGLQGRRASAAIRILQAHGLVVTDAARTEVEPSHDLVRAAVRDRMTAPEVEAAHRRMADALASVRAAPALRLAHLLAAGDVSRSDAEAAAAAALDDPALFAAPHQVAELGRNLIAVVGPAGADPAGVELRLLIASALIAIGDVAGGRRLIRLQQPVIDDLDDPALEAQAYLTQASLTLYGVDATEQRLRAEALLDRLPEDRAILRARLACWIGHAASSTDDLKARAMADRAEEILGDLDAPTVRTDILTLRLATSLSLTAPLGEADRALDRLEAMAPGISGVEIIVGPARLERALRTGRIDDVAAAVDHLDRMRTSGHWAMFRWWSLTTRSTLDLVRGDLVAAERSMIDAMAYGGRHGIELNIPTAVLHRFVLDWETGRFDRYHALLPPPDDDTTTARRLARVLTCVAAGDHEGGRTAADLLARPDLVTSAPGAGVWPVTVALGSHAAWLLDHAELGQVVLDAIDERADAGLGVVGLCYLGSISLARGLARAATGSIDTAIEELHQALERETWFGGPIWIARAASAAAELHERRDRSGDRDEAERLRRRAEEARATIRWPDGTAPPDAQRR